MKRTIIIAMGILGVALIAACGSPAASSGSASSPGQAGAASSPAAPMLTCADISTDLSKVVNDLKAQDEKYQEAWVSGGDSGDLQTLINDTQNAASGGSQLNIDAATFNSDASTYLSDNNPYLAPGWQSGYSTVTDCDAAIRCEVVRRRLAATSAVRPGADPMGRQAGRRLLRADGPDRG